MTQGCHKCQTGNGRTATPGEGRQQPLRPGSHCPEHSHTTGQSRPIHEESSSHHCEIGTDTAAPAVQRHTYMQGRCLGTHQRLALRCGPLPAPVHQLPPPPARPRGAHSPCPATRGRTCRSLGSTCRGPSTGWGSTFRKPWHSRGHGCRPGRTHTCRRNARRWAPGVAHADDMPCGRGPTTRD